MTVNIVSGGECDVFGNVARIQAACQVSDTPHIVQIQWIDAAERHANAMQRYRILLRDRFGLKPECPSCCKMIIG
jgi:hypothetical protein